MLEFIAGVVVGAVAVILWAPPESAWWHMRHRPYEVGGDANGNDEGAAGGVQELQGRDQGAAV